MKPRERGTFAWMGGFVQLVDGVVSVLANQALPATNPDRAVAAEQMLGTQGSRHPP